MGYRDINAGGHVALIARDAAGRRITRRMLCLGALLCAACAPTVYRWREPVRLQDGTVLTVQRSIQFDEYQPLGGGGGGSDIPVSTLDVLDPAPQRPQVWSVAHLIPMLLDREAATGEWFVVTTFFMCSTWYDLGRPQLPYAEFRYRNGAWVRVPLSPASIGREANLLVPNQADVKTDHTLESKKALMDNPEISPRHKRVISQWSTNC
jgi:hypothetical protein